MHARTSEGGGGALSLGARVARAFARPMPRAAHAEDVIGQVGHRHVAVKVRGQQRVLARSRAAALAPARAPASGPAPPRRRPPRGLRHHGLDEAQRCDVGGVGPRGRLADGDVIRVGQQEQLMERGGGSSAQRM